MPTSTKPRKTKRPTKQTPHGSPRATRGKSEQTPRRPSLLGISPKSTARPAASLMGRAQARLPGRKPQNKQSGGLRSGVTGLASSLASTSSGKKLLMIWLV